MAYILGGVSESSVGDGRGNGVGSGVGVVGGGSVGRSGGLPGGSGVLTLDCT